MKTELENLIRRFRFCTVYRIQIILTSPARPPSLPPHPLKSAFDFTLGKYANYYYFNKGTKQIILV